jgi:alginate O-acetyltransferase complex protein AlgI
MLFHSFPYFALFSLTFAVFWLLKRQDLRLILILVASCYFYMSWNPWLILLIFASTSVDYFVALQLDRLHDPRIRRLLLIFSIAINLGILGFFKYTNFFLDSTASLANLLGLWAPRSMIHVILPLGISFYTFEAISYIVDVYGKRLPAVRNPLHYMVFILFFPHLIAGPIVRPHHFLPQVTQFRQFDWMRFQLGANLFLQGLLKKAVIADNLAPIVDAVFASPASYGTSATWLAVLGYAAQIYCDFSGYSDMAIGSAHALGFKLPMNFSMPYFAANISEFWGRWHISLSTWLRDYLYIPLGGSRGGTTKTYRNLMITMLLGGLWHGAAWTFVFWGFYHGLLLVLHRLWVRFVPGAGEIFRPLSILITFLSVCVGWVFFRAQSFADAWLMLRRMVVITAGEDLASVDRRIIYVALAALLVGHLIGATTDARKWLQRVPAPVLGAGMACLLFLCQLLMPQDVKAFIYFQF